MDKEGKESLEKYGHFHSTHEIYAVLLEEVDEFWEVVKRKTLDINREEPYPLNALQIKRVDLVRELKQIRSIADRAIEELETAKVRFI